MSCSVLSLNACWSGIGGWWAGLVPDWLWPLLPYWPWMLVALALGVAYRFAGAAGLAVVAAAIGYVFGRRSVETPHENVEGADALPPVAGKPVVRPGPRPVRPDDLPPKSLTER